MKKLLTVALPLALVAACQSNDTPESASTDAPCLPTEYDAGLAYVEGGAEPINDGAKMLWADHSSLWTGMPPLEVETWMGPKPDIKGKFLLVTFWNTWCPHCRRALPIYSDIQKKLKDDLVVIEITEEGVDTVRKFLDGRDKYASHFAIDTKARMRTAIGVIGVPHAILVEPDEQTIIWEGYPLQRGYELTEETIKRYIDKRKEALSGK